MIKRADWFPDKRPLRMSRGTYSPPVPWEEWLAKNRRRKEQWLMSIIDLLMENRDWAGPYMLIQTYIATCKRVEGNMYYNRTPFDESVHVRAVRYWFWSMVEKHGYVIPDEEIDYTGEKLGIRREFEEQFEASYPFVGGKPKRQYSEAVDFFQQAGEDRRLMRKKPEKK